MNKRLAGILVCLGALAAIPAQAEDVLLRNEEYSFRLSYPDTWSEVEPGGGNVRASVTSEGGRGPANCNVVVLPPPAEWEDRSREEIEAELTGLFTREFMEQVVAGTSGAKLIESHEDELDGRPAGFATVDFVEETDGVTLVMTNMAALTAMKKGMYILTCGAVKELFEQSRPELLAIIGSFAIDD